MFNYKVNSSIIKKRKQIPSLPPNSLLGKDEATVEREKENLIKKLEARIAFYKEKIDKASYRGELHTNKMDMLKRCLAYLDGTLLYSQLLLNANTLHGWNAGLFSQQTATLVTETTRFVKEYKEYKELNLPISVQSQNQIKRAVNRGKPDRDNLRSTLQLQSG